MQQTNRGDQLSKSSRRLAIAIAACGLAAAPVSHASPPGDIVVVPSADLSESARQSGDAMFLRETGEGRALLYIERSDSTVLAILDVTDPRHIRNVRLPKLNGPTNGRDKFIGQVARDCDAGDIDRVVDLNQVRKTVTNCATGTTFAFTDIGLVVIRRPAVEWEKTQRDQRWYWEHTGG